MGNPHFTKKMTPSKLFSQKKDLMVTMTVYLSSYGFGFSHTNPVKNAHRIPMYNIP